ncbi:MAG: PIG-L family deacetylase [Chloroflexota bacterium]
MAGPRALLATFAHPDDEVFGTGGTLALYASEGVRVSLVCATRGEVGEISDPALASPDTLPQVREEELRCSLRALGIDDVVLLGYRDSGMAGTADNDHPRAFCNAPAEEVVARLVEEIRRTRPQVAVTFGPGGGYGHPDHIAIHQHTLAAVQVAADPAFRSDLGQPWSIARLFYTTIPRSLFWEMRERMRDLGLDTSPFEGMADRLKDLPEERVDVSMDVSTHFEAKWTAMTCHRTQMSTDSPFNQLPENIMKQVFSREFFILGQPETPPAKPLTGLFDGL